jgi:hypothetical protein
MPVGSTVLPRPPPGETCSGIPCRGNFLPDATEARGASQFDRSLRGIGSAGGSDQYASNYPYDTINNQ